MSKKKKKVAYKYYGDSKKRKKDDRKRRKNRGPKIETVGMSLDKSEIKAARKIICTPVKVSKNFTEIREKCNHAGKLLTVAEYKDMTAVYNVYTPILDWAVAKFGEENVHVCRGCYDAVINPELIKSSDVQDAMMMLYAAVNKALTMKKMKKKEIKDLAELKDKLNDFNEVAEIIEKIDAVNEALGVTVENDSGAAKVSLQQQMMAAGSQVF